MTDQNKTQGDWRGFDACKARLTRNAQALDVLAADRMPSESAQTWRGVNRCTCHGGVHVSTAQGCDFGLAKDGIEAALAAWFWNLVDQAESLDALFKANVNVEAVALDNAVNGAAGVADGNAVAVSAIPWTGVLLRDGQYFLVDGERLYAFEELCLHGAVSKLDAAWFKAMEGVLRMACHRAQGADSRR